MGPKAAVAEFLLSRPVAAVRVRHRDRPLIGAFVVDGRNSAVVPKKREGARRLDTWQLLLSFSAQLPGERSSAPKQAGALGAPKSAA